MRTIIAGSRGITSYDAVCIAIEASGIEITEVVSGTAKGVDTLGERYAIENNIPIKRFPAKWKEFGKRAGLLRNTEMAEYAEALIAIWDGKSPGTRDMINKGKFFGLNVCINIF